jgi:phosphate/sulfate permease
MDLYVFALIILFLLAISDLIVGISNDAVNFLNSSLGSKPAPRYVILVIASMGILAGVTFSSGMMEVARKGIFHPRYFVMSEIMVIFLAVMLTDILLLDVFNTFGFPTSTTVSIVFELLGAAVAVSLVKIIQTEAGISSFETYININKAFVIISGILLSVVVAFIFGALVQFVTRLIFTFDYSKRLRRYGAVWGGCALTAIIYFIVIKGAKGASFISPETLTWLQTHAFAVLLGSFLGSAIILEALLLFSRINILKLIVLAGTFALAMSFAANDLVNFIGVPLAGLSAFSLAQGSSDPLSMTMEALQQPVRSNTLLLLVAGMIMVVTLWVSRKARTVTKTEISLGRQDEGIERFGASYISRTIVRMGLSLFDTMSRMTPEAFRKLIFRRLDPKRYNPSSSKGQTPPSFDLLRASVNLMVASAVISFATSLKLPLSTTYVTFMVAMGASFSDRAWGRESAVYRVAGVINVIGGWFFTAFSAFTLSLIYAFLIYYFRLPAILILCGFSVFLIWHSYRFHSRLETEAKEIEVFDLKRLSDAAYGVKMSFEHGGYFLQQVNSSLDACYRGLYNQNRRVLKTVRRGTDRIQKMANVIIANIFKTLRLLEKEEVTDIQEYALIIGVFQEIAESHRDIIIRSYLHVENQHKSLTEIQLKELTEIMECLCDLLESASRALLKREITNYKAIIMKNRKLKQLAKEFAGNQVKRIQNGSSKTRLSILYYGLIWDAQKISEQSVNLLKVFRNSLKLEPKRVPTL